jgi:hypothetical protein
MNLKTNKKISMRPIFTIITHSSYSSSSPAMRDNATGGRALSHVRLLLIEKMSEQPCLTLCVNDPAR